MGFNYLCIKLKTSPDSYKISTFGHKQMGLQDFVMHRQSILTPEYVLHSYPGHKSLSKSKCTQILQLR